MKKFWMVYQPTVYSQLVEMHPTYEKAAWRAREVALEHEGQPVVVMESAMAFHADVTVVQMEEELGESSDV
jgi:hypothetical protein